MQKKKILVNDKNITPTWHPIFKHPICKTYLHLQKCTSELKEEKKQFYRWYLRKKKEGKNVKKREIKRKRKIERKDHWHNTRAAVELKTEFGFCLLFNFK